VARRAGVWEQYPRTAPPAWTNLFKREKVPETMFLSSADGSAEKVLYPGENDVNTIGDDLYLRLSVRYLPGRHEPVLHRQVQNKAAAPVDLLAAALLGADPGRGYGLGKVTTYIFSQDTKLQRGWADCRRESPVRSRPAGGPDPPVRGIYQVRVSATTFEPGSDVDGEFVLYGQVYGIAGTDHLRRDLRVALLWGTPVALAFGLIAALGTTILTMGIAAIATWFGGWVDTVVQRITAVNMVLPFLPILIMIGTFYSRSIVVILGAVILLSIFTGSIMTYRAIFLQVKEAPYIEAARAYGAGSWRIIFSYLTPRIIPMLIPNLVAAIPGFVFLEAALAFLGLGDPSLPTWGKVISDAQQNGALYQGLYYWVLEPRPYWS